MIVSHVYIKWCSILKPSNLNNISFIFGIGYGFLFNCLFRFLKSLGKRTRFYLGLGCAKDGAPHSESFTTSVTHTRTKRPTSLLNIYSCTFSTGYGCDNIGFKFSFNLKSTESVFQVSSVPSNKSLNLCNVLATHYIVLLLDVDIGFT